LLSGELQRDVDDLVGPPPPCYERKDDVTAADIAPG
jgi:hypothetical protein